MYSVYGASLYTCRMYRVETQIYIRMKIYYSDSDCVAAMNCVNFRPRTWFGPDQIFTEKYRKQKCLKCLPLYKFCQFIGQSKLSIRTVFFGCFLTYLTFFFIPEQFSIAVNIIPVWIFRFLKQNVCNVACEMFWIEWKWFFFHFVCCLFFLNYFLCVSDGIETQFENVLWNAVNLMRKINNKKSLTITEEIV